jgi:hypothetical protein
MVRSLLLLFTGSVGLIIGIDWPRIANAAQGPCAGGLQGRCHCNYPFVLNGQSQAVFCEGFQRLDYYCNNTMGTCTDMSCKCFINLHTRMLACWVTAGQPDLNCWMLCAPNGEKCGSFSPDCRIAYEGAEQTTVPCNGVPQD